MKTTVLQSIGAHAVLTLMKFVRANVKTDRRTRTVYPLNDTVLVYLYIMVTNETGEALEGTPLNVVNVTCLRQFTPALVA